MNLTNKLTFFPLTYMVGAVSLPIKFLLCLLDCDIFNPESYFFANFVHQVAMRFGIFACLIILCVWQRFYDSFLYDT